MNKKREKEKWINKSPVIIFLLCLIYSLLNAGLVVLCFINAEKLGWKFLIMIGFIFLANVLVQASVFKKREKQAVRALFGDDEEGYAEFQEKCKMFPKKDSKKMKEKRQCEFG